MNLVEAFNIIQQSARSVQTTGIEHDKIRDALNIVGKVIQEKLDAEQKNQEGNDK